MGTIANIEKRLKKEIRASGVKVRYRKAYHIRPSTFGNDYAGPVKSRGAGFYNTDHKRITIYQNPDKSIPIQIVIVLAHEFGHAIDHKMRGTRKYWAQPEYTAEVVAWEYAREVLLSLGFTNWPAYWKRRTWALRTYS